LHSFQAYISAKSKVRQAATKKQLKKDRQKKKKADALKYKVEKIQVKAQNTTAPTKKQLKKARQKKKKADALKKKVEKIQVKLQNTPYQAGPSPSTD
jgi:DNA repair ATPase RecN